MKGDVTAAVRLLHLKANHMVIIIIQTEILGKKRESRHMSRVKAYLTCRRNQEGLMCLESLEGKKDELSGDW